MKLTFLGTGAADWTEKDFVDGHEYRRWSSALIDGSLLIDPGPHIYHFAEKNGASDMFGGIKSVIVTHSHKDHFSSETLKALSCEAGFRLYGDAACLRILKRELAEDELAKIGFTDVAPFDSFTTDDGYIITVLPSNHGTSDPLEKTHHYIIEKDGKRLFYGPDGAWLFYPAWQKMRGKHFDAMILEATVGYIPGDDRIFSHNSLPMLEIMLQTFRAQGCLDETSKVYCSHMAKTLHPAHKVLERELVPLGITPAYDGLSIKI